MAVLGYVRVSTEEQNVKNQRHEILEYANSNHIQVNDWIEIEVSSKKTKFERKIDEMFSKLHQGDTLIVSELSRLGRNTSEVIDIINQLIANQVGFISIKQNLNITDKLDMTGKVIVTLFSLFAELERDLISERTKQALAARKAQGIKLGKPKGTIQSSRLDEYKPKIIELLGYGVSKSAIARVVSTSRTNLFEYIKKRNLEVVPKRPKRQKVDDK
jgi:DNA invertase Pin-like site-specific DNA recombinase